VNGTRNLVFDPERAGLVRDAFQMIADGQRLEHVLRVVTGLGLRNLKGKTVNKQTFSKMMRNKVYTGEITSGGITARGSFKPLIPEDIFQRAQDVLTSRVRKREHPLRGFVMCPSCKSKLTAAGCAEGMAQR
jgi:hypothetical protein